MPLYVIYPRKIYVSTREKFATVEIHTLYVIRCKSVSLTLKQAKRASGDRKVTKRATLSSLKPVQTDATLLANNSQYCWMLHVASVCTPCCMLLGVVASACAPLPTRTQQLPTLLAQQCWVAASACKTKPNDYSVFLCFQNPRWRLHAGKFVGTTILLLAIVRFLHHILSL